MSAIGHNRQLDALRGLRDDYERIHSNDPDALPMLSLVGLRVMRLTASVEDLLGRTHQRAGEAGWVRLQSHVVVLGEGAGCALPNPCRPIAGEWRESDASSIHIRPDGGGSVSAWRYEERPLADGALAAGERPALREVMQVLRHGIELSVRARETTKPGLVYHVFWGAGVEKDAHEIRRLCHRFVRFADVQAVVYPARN